MIWEKTGLGTLSSNAGVPCLMAINGNHEKAVGRYVPIRRIKCDTVIEREFHRVHDRRSL